MSVEFNHTIVWSRDSEASARFLAHTLGLPAPQRWGPFQVVTMANAVNVDFMDKEGEIRKQHYAFLVSEAEFDQILARVKNEGLSHWADPAQTKAGEINRHDGGRGTYFEDPSGHLLEIITRPYGSSGWKP
jgi:catechol 2,3-dioxygenase-like lactoylglutathione lyase family enzyme